MGALPITFSTARNDQGFTLLELLMVVTILSAVAWMTMEMVHNNADQTRFETTRERLSAIRRAIIGDSSRTLNGQPEICGYVADMGGLPPDLNALLHKDYCSDPKYDNQSDCTSNSETWHVRGEHCENANFDSSNCVSNGYEWKDGYYYYNDIYEFWMGWNGPYVEASELASYPRLLDGWGNDDETNDFGWNINVDTPNAGDLMIQSLGRDAATGPDPTDPTTDDYDADYPQTTTIPLISNSEYSMQITDSTGNGGLIVDFGTIPPCWACWDETTATSPNFNNRSDCEDPDNSTHNNYKWIPVYVEELQATCEAVDLDSDGTPDGVWLKPPNTPITDTLCLRVTRRSSGVITELVSSAHQTYIWNGSRQMIDFIFPNGTRIDQGQMAYRIFEYDTSTSPPSCTDYSFLKGSDEWKTFTILPGAVVNILPWEVQ